MPADPARLLSDDEDEAAFVYNETVDDHGAACAAVAAEAERRHRAADLALCCEELDEKIASFVAYPVTSGVLERLKARLVARLGPEAPTEEKP